MDIRRFHKRLADAADGLIQPGAVVVCAVSGGADSMALLAGLIRVNEIRRRSWRLVVGHVDHGLRVESPDDARFVEAYATLNGLPFHVKRIDARSAAHRMRMGVEEAARSERYRFLRDLAESVGAKVVAVAHHADDQAETILHRIVRGTGLRGLSGMPVWRPIAAGSEVALVRPLLGMGRDELLDYLTARRIAFRQDATNHDPNAATRNRIRVNVLPMLRQTLNPAVSVALLRLAEHARRADAVVRQTALEALRHMRIEESPRRLVLPVADMIGQPAAIAAEIIRLVVDRLGVGQQEIGFERIEAVRELLAGDGRLRTIELPNGATVERRGGRLIFQSRPAPATITTCPPIHATQGRCD